LPFGFLLLLATTYPTLPSFIAVLTIVHYDGTSTLSLYTITLSKTVVSLEQSVKVLRVILDLKLK
jgi:hypothetical protein